MDLRQHALHRSLKAYSSENYMLATLEPYGPDRVQYK